MPDYKRKVEQQFDSVVILAPFPWQQVWQSTHYIADYLSKRLPVLYVEPPPMWFPNSDLFSTSRLIQMLSAGRLRRRSIGMNVLVPRSAPFGRSPRMRAWIDRLYARDVLQASKRLRFQRPLYWTFNDSIRKMETSTMVEHFVYQCLDLYRDTEEEKETTRRATVVFAVSNALCQKHQPLNSKCFLVPNGIDTALFRSRSRDHYERPADLPAGKPMIGYAGTISAHNDLTLLERVALAFPFADVVLVGPLRKGDWGPQGKQKMALDALRMLPNVHLLGERSVLQLPDYLQSFDVCVVASLVDEWSRHADPLKFLQYLAMEKPTVAMRMPSFEPYTSLCYLADSPESFVKQVERALSEVPYEKIARRRRAAVSTRSWDAIIGKACQILKEQGCILPEPVTSHRAAGSTDGTRRASARF